MVAVNDGLKAAEEGIVTHKQESKDSLKDSLKDSFSDAKQFNNINSSTATDSGINKSSSLLVAHNSQLSNGSISSDTVGPAADSTTVPIQVDTSETPTGRRISRIELVESDTISGIEVTETPTRIEIDAPTPIEEVDTPTSIEFDTTKNTATLREDAPADKNNSDIPTLPSKHNLILTAGSLAQVTCQVTGFDKMISSQGASRGTSNRASPAVSPRVSPRMSPRISPRVSDLENRANNTIDLGLVESETVRSLVAKFGPNEKIPLSEGEWYYLLANDWIDSWKLWYSDPSVQSPKASPSYKDPLHAVESSNSLGGGNFVLEGHFQEGQENAQENAELAGTTTTSSSGHLLPTTSSGPLGQTLLLGQETSGPLLGRLEEVRATREDGFKAENVEMELRELDGGNKFEEESNHEDGNVLLVKPRSSSTSQFRTSPLGSPLVRPSFSVKERPGRITNVSLLVEKVTKKADGNETLMIAPPEPLTKSNDDNQNESGSARQEMIIKVFSSELVGGRKEDTFIEDVELKRDVKRDVNFTILNEKVWNFLAERYGFDYCIKRRAIHQSSSSLEPPQLELFGYKLPIYISIILDEEEKKETIEDTTTSTDENNHILKIGNERIKPGGESTIQIEYWDSQNAHPKDVVTRLAKYFGLDKTCTDEEGNKFGLSDSETTEGAEDIHMCGSQVNTQPVVADGSTAIIALPTPPREEEEAKSLFLREEARPLDVIALPPPPPTTTFRKLRLWDFFQNRRYLLLKPGDSLTMQKVTPDNPCLLEVSNSKGEFPANISGNSTGGFFTGYGTANNGYTGFSSLVDNSSSNFSRNTTLYAGNNRTNYNNWEDVATSGNPDCVGAVGLQNLGNTCFMNSSLQCLSNIPPLRRYFITDDFKQDLNPTAWKTNGKLAESFAGLMKLIWRLEGDQQDSGNATSSTNVSSATRTAASTPVAAGDRTSNIESTVATAVDCTDPFTLDDGCIPDTDSSIGACETSLIGADISGISTCDTSIELGSVVELGSRAGIVENRICRRAGTRKGAYVRIAPRAFKHKIGEVAEQFSGYGQHDSMEFIEALVDGLKEDLNHNQGPLPFVELKEADGRPDSIVAKEAKDNYNMRNKSFIDNLFLGFEKSTCVCPKCGKESVKFDPVLSTKLRLTKKTTTIQVSVNIVGLGKPFYKHTDNPINAVPTSGNSSNTPSATANNTSSGATANTSSGNSLSTVTPFPAMRSPSDDQIPVIVPIPKLENDSLTVEISRTGSIKDLIQQLVTDHPERCGHWDVESNVLVAEVLHGRIRKFFESGDCIDVFHETDLLYVFEVESRNPFIEVEAEIPTLNVDNNSNNNNSSVVDDLFNDNNPRSPVAMNIDSVVSPNGNNNVLDMVEGTSVLNTTGDDDIEMRIETQDDISMTQLTEQPQLLQHAQLNQEHPVIEYIGCIVAMHRASKIPPMVFMCRKDILVWEFYQLVEQKAKVHFATPEIPEFKIVKGNDAGNMGRYRMNLSRLVTQNTTDGMDIRYLVEDGKGGSMPNQERLFEDSANGKQYFRVVEVGQFPELSFPEPRIVHEEEHRKKNSFINQSKETPVGLRSLFDMYVTREQLGESEMWYCPQCKEHVCAFKTLNFFSLPPIMIIQLSRFSYSRYSRVRMDTPVDFPLENLDLDDLVLENQEENLGWDNDEEADLVLENQEENTTFKEKRNVYDLIGLTKHMGDSGGGHYVAYSKSNISNRWYLFDDSHVTVSSEEDVKSERVGAYVLFYKRKDISWKDLKKINKNAETVATKSGNTTVSGGYTEGDMNDNDRGPQQQESFPSHEQPRSHQITTGTNVILNFGNRNISNANSNATSSVNDPIANPSSSKSRNASPKNTRNNSSSPVTSPNHSYYASDAMEVRSNNRVDETIAGTAKRRREDMYEGGGLVGGDGMHGIRRGGMNGISDGRPTRLGAIAADESIDDQGMMRID